MTAPDLGGYRLVAPLGEGGMARVYIGEHTVLGRHVAIKVLHEHYLADEHTQARFFHEARAMAGLRHPSIVDVFDFGRTSDGHAYIVMELLRGETLKRRLARGRLSLGDAIDLGRQIALAMAAAHEHGVVHRDVKPENVLLVPHAEAPGRLRAKVLDFGIAKHAEVPASDRLTRVGILLGTPAYMSPEQCRGDEDVDWRSDIYSLGVVLYRMVTGMRPFAARDVREMIRAHLFATPSRPRVHDPTLPRAVDDVVMRCLHKQPGSRFANMKELADALAGAADRRDGVPVVAPARVLRLPLDPPDDTVVAAAGPVAVPGRPRRWLTCAAVAAAALAAVTSTGWLNDARSARDVPALEAAPPAVSGVVVTPSRRVAPAERAALAPSNDEPETALPAARSVRRRAVRPRDHHDRSRRATMQRREFEKPVL